MTAINAVQNNYYQPRFTNAARLLADADKKLSFVRVVNGVANITNGKVLIRRRVDIPDGAYNVNIDGSLSETDYQGWMDYPDFELIKPPFERLKAFAKLTRTDLEKTLRASNAIYERKGTIIMDHEKIYCEQDTSLGMAFPFNLSSPTRINPWAFSICLVELLQYKEVALTREIRETVGNEKLLTPLVFGRDWSSCILIMPMERPYPYGQHFR